MTKKIVGILSLVMASAFIYSCTPPPSPQPTSVPSINVQLNWLHDPTFAGEYLLSQRSDIKVSLKEGGPNIFPLAEVSNGRAEAAIVGADIFLQSVDKEIKAGRESNLVSFFVDFQRNPVGWVLHPDAAARAGITEEVKNAPKKLNQWLFGKFANGTLKVGDKRGTETTAIWMQWKLLQNLPDSINVVPVGFDTSVVLSAPMLAYPVYLNEEPYKLSEKIGRSILVFDPAVDGIELYGNVLVTRADYAKNNSQVIRLLQSALRESWQKAKDNPAAASAEVAKYYKGVSQAILDQQIGKTLDFVFYGDQLPGAMDVSKGGRWNKTLNALQQAGIVGTALTYEKLSGSLLSPQ